MERSYQICFPQICGRSCKPPVIFLRKSYEFLAAAFPQGQADGKGDPVVRAGSPDRPAVEGKDFLGYGQAKARAARAGGAGAVQPEELVEDALQLLRRNGPPSLVNVRTTVSASCCPVIRTVDPGKL